jgi:hypothetical protein
VSVPESKDLDVRPTRVMLVGSSGGHLAQLCALRPWSAPLERTWVTFDTPDALSRLAGERVFWAYHPTTRNAWNLLRNLVLAVRLVTRERPDVIVSTGAGVAFPVMVIGWLRNSVTVYIEVVDRLDTPTLTGRLCRPVTTVFCVQWPQEPKLYDGAGVFGRLM